MATSDCVVSFKLLMIGDTNVVRTTVSLISHTYAANSSLSVSVSVFFVSVSVSLFSVCVCVCVSLSLPCLLVCVPACVCLCLWCGMSGEEQPRRPLRYGQVFFCAAANDWHRLPVRSVRPSRPPSFVFTLSPPSSAPSLHWRVCAHARTHGCASYRSRAPLTSETVVATAPRVVRYDVAAFVCVAVG